MRIFILSDLHFGISNSALSWRDIMINYIKNDFLKSAEENGLNSDTDELFVLGDVFNSRESINIMILDYVVDVFNELSKHFKAIRIIVGNHDAYYIDNNNINSVAFIGRLIENKNIFAYKEPEQIVCSGAKMLLLPWIKDDELIAKTISEDNSDFIFCHANISGMRMDSGISIKDGINSDSLSKYKHIYSGHIHKKQSNKNITYVGTPYQLNWGDVDEVKGYHIIDCENNFKLKFVENVTTPKFKKILIYDLLNLNIQEAQLQMNNNFVIVICDSRTYNLINFIQLIDKFKSFDINPYTIQFVEVKDVNENTTLDEALANMSFDIEASSVELLKAQNKTETEINKITAFLMDLYKKVKKDEING